MITGKVAAILNSSTVIINVGADQGVKPGSAFKAIYKSPQIVDPDDPTNILDGLTFDIAALIAEKVFDKFTYCKITNPYTQATVDFGFGKMFKYESKIAPGEHVILDDDTLKIRIGTPVHQTLAPPPPEPKPET